VGQGVARGGGSKTALPKKVAVTLVDERGETYRREVPIRLAGQEGNVTWSGRRGKQMTRRRENEKGIALLVTLLILVLVVALVHEVFRIGAQSAQSGAYGRDSIRCILLAEGGTGAARIVLRIDARDNQYDTLDEIWSRAALPITLGTGKSGSPSRTRNGRST